MSNFDCTQVTVQLNGDDIARLPPLDDVSMNEGKGKKEKKGRTKWGGVGLNHLRWCAGDAALLWTHDISYRVAPDEVGRVVRPCLLGCYSDTQRNPITIIQPHHLHTPSFEILD